MMDNGIEFEEQDSLGLESQTRNEDVDFTFFARTLKRFNLIKTQKQSQYVLLGLTILFFCIAALVIMYSLHIGFFSLNNKIIPIPTNLSKVK